MRVKSASLAEARAATCADRPAATRAAFLAGVLSLALEGCAMHPAGAPAAFPARSTSQDQWPDRSAPAARARAADSMVEVATSMLGQPYRFGGAAPGGFDCSGLVSFAAQSAGLQVPRTAGEQLQAGMRIGRGDIEPGDLVFMRLAHKDLHVGIAIGGGRFIHAPARGGRVRIDSLLAAPYSSGFIGARRVVASGSLPSGP